MFLFSNIIPAGIEKHFYVMFLIIPVLIISCSSSKIVEEKSFDIGLTDGRRTSWYLNSS